MGTWNVAMPDAVKPFIESQLGIGGYRDESEYIQELIRAEQRRKAEERIDELLLEGLNSGEPIVVDEAYRAERRRRLDDVIAGLIGQNP